MTFGAADEAGEHAVTLYTLSGPDANDDSAPGDLLVQGHTNAAVLGPGGVRLWAGKVREPFYNDLTRLAALAAAVKDGTTPDLADWRPERATNAFSGATVHAIVLEVPDDEPRLGTDRDIAVWTVTKLATDSGGWQQVNRQAHPLLWPLFRTAHRDWAIDANRRHPQSDLRDDGERLAGIVAAVVAANGTSDDPAGYAAAAVRRLLPDVMPYRTGTAASFGFAGMNGRALGDNAVEVMFSLAFNTATTLGLRPEQNADTRTDRFPYVVSAP